VLGRDGASAAIGADLVKSSWQIAGRAHGTGAHGPSLAEPLHLFYAFATHRAIHYIDRLLKPAACGRGSIP
jgi:hypothetical protein